MNVLADRPHFVYRVFDADDRLLYVGCTVNVDRRLRQHRYTSQWFPEMARWTTEEHVGIIAGRCAEEDAIRAENPLHNKAHAGIWYVRSSEAIRAMVVEQARQMGLSASDFEGAA